MVTVGGHGAAAERGTPSVAAYAIGVGRVAGTYAATGALLGGSGRPSSAKPASSFARAPDGKILVAAKAAREETDGALNGVIGRVPGVSGPAPRERQELMGG